MSPAEAMQGLSTCDLSDACDALGIAAVSSGALKAVHARCGAICGPVATCRMSPRGSTEIVIGTLAPLLAAAPGTILLVDAGGEMRLNTIGSLVGVVALQQWLAGAIVDGCVRDVSGLEELGFPTWARGTVVTSVRGRVGIESTGEPVLLDGGRVLPGWIAAADANGVIAFPPERQQEVFEHARRAVALERRLFEQIRAGADAVALHRALKYDQPMGEQLQHPPTTGEPP